MTVPVFERREDFDPTEPVLAGVGEDEGGSDPGGLEPDELRDVTRTDRVEAKGPDGLLRQAARLKVGQMVGMQGPDPLRPRGAGAELRGPPRGSSSFGKSSP